MIIRRKGQFVVTKKSLGVAKSPRAKTLAEARKRAGGSNVGKYARVKKVDFAGPSGGAPQGSYPINTVKRAKSALKLAHNAPRPAGIRKAVEKKYPSLKKG